MREIVSNLIHQSRIRRQDADPKMILAKPGDTTKVKTILYVDESGDAGVEHYGPGYFSKQAMFVPKETEPFEFVCTSNANKELNHLLGSEYDSRNERQDN